MIANPTRVEWEAVTSPLQQGNRVLEALARQQALRALLAFSSLHQQIRNRRLAARHDSASDFFETERFILDEVLQLICDRVQTITEADGIVVALAERSATMCRAAAGSLSVARGVHLTESELLEDCLESGRIVRCDDCEIDARAGLDFARQLGARSMVLVPLRGGGEQLGVLQAFSRTPWAFTDHDVRCFDLFAELVLSALKPEDQDRRIGWLSGVADEVLQVKTAVSLPLAAKPAPPETRELETPKSDTAEVAILKIATPEIEPSRISAKTAAAPSPSSSLSPAKVQTLAAAPPASDWAVLLRPVVIPTALVERSETGIAVESISSEEPGDLVEAEKPETEELDTDEVEGEEFALEEPAVLAQTLRSPSFLERLSLASGSHPGLSAVLSLVAVAALFSAGAWWGMEEQGKKVPKVARTNTAAQPAAVATPPAPSTDVISLAISGDLTDPEKPGSETAPLPEVTENKSATLSKITGVRHWSSSAGSTVVIDMDDQVPYEIHRLMSPERIYFDLHDTALSPELNGKTMEVGDTSLTRVRVAQLSTGVTRIVLDTKGGSNFSVSMESSPYRLVVELHGADKTMAANSVPAKQERASADLTPAPSKAVPAPTLATKASDQPSPARTGKIRIVLDAGHGGWDSGTVGRQGLLEKDLVLDVTERLGRLLRERLGVEVMFTRTADTYVPLEQRADFANTAQADLFVSVHANYSTYAEARGVETYYTNLFSAPGSRDVEKHEDGTFVKPMPVSLSADALHEKIEESQRLAASVQHSLYSALAANSSGIRNRGIKDSAFVVLTGTTMPAVLTEISFVSSPADEHNLQTTGYRQQIAEALYEGIAHYEQSSSRARVAQLQAGPRR